MTQFQIMADLNDERLLQDPVLVGIEALLCSIIANYEALDRGDFCGKWNGVLCR